MNNSESILNYCNLRKKIVPFHKNISIKDNVIYLKGEISIENLEKIQSLLPNSSTLPVYNNLEETYMIIIN